MRARMAGGVGVGAALAALVLAGCGTDTPFIPMEPISFSVALSGENEVPPLTTGGSGNLQVTLDGSRLQVQGSFANLQSDLFEVAGSSAHIHRAAAGANGPIVLNVQVDSGDRRSGTLTLDETLTQEQVDDFRAGLHYLNVHTQQNPGGELRGQLSGQSTAPPAVVSEVPDDDLYPDAD